MFKEKERLYDYALQMLLRKRKVDDKYSVLRESSSREHSKNHK